MQVPFRRLLARVHPCPAFPYLGRVCESMHAFRLPLERARAALLPQPQRDTPRPSERPHVLYIRPPTPPEREWRKHTCVSGFRATRETAASASVLHRDGITYSTVLPIERDRGASVSALLSFLCIRFFSLLLGLTTPVQAYMILQSYSRVFPVDSRPPRMPNCPRKYVQVRKLQSFDTVKRWALRRNRSCESPHRFLALLH